MTHPQPRTSPGLRNFYRRADAARINFMQERGGEVLARLIGHNPEHIQALNQAHETLKLDVNYPSAMHTAARTLKAGKINVFVSYRSTTDAEAAKTLTTAFRELSAGRVNLTLQDEFTGNIPGREYKKEIERAIKDAHWFILLASDPANTSGWCMFETGMFQGSMVSKKINRLICIHHPHAVLPDPIDEYQAVKATPERLEKFLDGLFRNPEPLPGWHAINPDATSETIKATASRISKAFKAPGKPTVFNYGVTLVLPDDVPLGSWHDLKEVSIKTDLRTAELFGKTEPPITWGDLINNVAGHNNTTKWLEEICSVLEKARRNDIFRPISATFESNVNGKVMRPILHSMEHRGNEHHFHLQFVEEFSTSPRHQISPKMLALRTSVRMNERIRWEIIERFQNVKWSRGQIAACEKVFSRIERELQPLGSWDVDLLCSNFERQARDKVRAIVEQWRKLRVSGTDDPQHLTGALDEALEPGMRELIAECADLYRDFLHLVYPVLLADVTNKITEAS